MSDSTDPDGPDSNNDEESMAWLVPNKVHPKTHDLVPAGASPHLVSFFYRGLFYGTNVP